MPRFSFLFTRLLPGLFLLGLLAAYAGLHWLDQQIFAPPRRALAAYHLQYLDYPELSGMRIREFGCLQGQVPCLLVEAAAAPGAGGWILRTQLRERGVALAAYGQLHATLVLLHGRNGRKEAMLGVAERFVAAGFRVIIPDLPGHGDSPLMQTAFGSSAFEQALPARVLAEVREQFQLGAEPAFLWGLSMGGAFAVNALNHSPQHWQGGIIVSSFAQLSGVLLDLLPAEYQPYGPELLTLLDWQRRLRGKPPVSAMQPAQLASRIRLPMLHIHGDRDSYIPLVQGQALFAAVGSADKQWLTVPGGGHRSVLSTPMQLYAAMADWLLARAPVPAAH